MKEREPERELVCERERVRERRGEERDYNNIIIIKMFLYSAISQPNGLSQSAVGRNANQYIHSLSHFHNNNIHILN